MQYFLYSFHVMNLHLMMLVFSYFDICFNTILQLNFLASSSLSNIFSQKKSQSHRVKLKIRFFFKNVKVCFYFVIKVSVCTCREAPLKFREQLCWVGFLPPSLHVPGIELGLSASGFYALIHLAGQSSRPLSFL